MNAISVTKLSKGIVVLKLIQRFILVRSHIYAAFVINLYHKIYFLISYENTH